MVYEEDTSEADGLPDPDKENIGEEDLNVQEEIEDLEAKNIKEIKPDSEADGLPDPDKDNIGEEDLTVQEEIEDFEAKNTKEIKPESGERDSV